MNTQPTHPLVPAERVNGTDVYNDQGDKLGHIQDVAIDKVNGNVCYAIMSFGGFLGMGENYHPVPWSLLTYDVDKGGYVIPLNKAALQEAPSFDPKGLSGWNDAASRDSVYNYYAPYGVTPYW